MKYKVSAETTSIIAQDGLREARILAPKDTGVGAATLSVESGEGWATIKFGKHYMSLQNKGFAGFLMTALAGKVIPMRNKFSGRISFRYANPDTIGQRRIRDRDPKTGQILPGNNPIRWRHPGLKSKNFAEKGMEIAVRKNANLIVKDFLTNGIPKVRR